MAEPKIFKKDDIDRAANFIKAGGILAYPSESVWGLGCDAFNDVAIERIFQLKSRPSHKGLIVLTDGVDKLMPLFYHLPKGVQADLLQKIHALNDAFDVKTAMRAQTWLVPMAKSLQLPKILTNGCDTLAVRVTRHLPLVQICQAITDDSNPYGFLVSTSCNLSGKPSALNLGQAMDYFGEQVAYLDAPTLGFIQPSQIVDVVTGTILR